jgi:hypothetical protein
MNRYYYHVQGRVAVFSQGTCDPNQPADDDNLLRVTLIVTITLFPLIYYSDKNTNQRLLFIQFIGSKCQHFLKVIVVPLNTADTFSPSLSTSVKVKLLQFSKNLILSRKGS